MRDDDPVFVTAPLLAVLLELARDAEPTAVSVGLSTRPAGDLEPADDEGRNPGPADGGSDRVGGDGSDDGERPLTTVDEATPVFADFTFPDAGAAVNRVFGMDLGQPVGQTRGRFVSHPTGGPSLDRSDDLAPRVLVAVPPWEPTSVRAYDRRGNRLALAVLSARAPVEPFEGDPTEG
ncbi:MAG: hypothetical protein ABEJ76_06430 [Halanaeroarchaeum sp.]